MTVPVYPFRPAFRPGRLPIWEIWNAKPNQNTTAQQTILFRSAFKCVSPAPIPKNSNSVEVAKLISFVRVGLETQGKETYHGSITPPSTFFSTLRAGKQQGVLRQLRVGFPFGCLICS